MGKFKRPKKMCLNIGLLCFLKTKQSISNIEIFSKIENKKKRIIKNGVLIQGCQIFICSLGDDPRFRGL